MILIVEFFNVHMGCAMIQRNRFPLSSRSYKQGQIGYTKYLEISH